MPGTGPVHGFKRVKHRKKNGRVTSGKNVGKKRKRKAIKGGRRREGNIATRASIETSEKKNRHTRNKIREKGKGSVTIIL